MAAHRLKFPPEVPAIFAMEMFSLCDAHCIKVMIFERGGRKYLFILSIYISLFSDYQKKLNV